VIADLDKLIELQHTDTNLRRLKQSVETSETRRAKIEQEFEQHASSIREIQNRRDSMHAKRADLEKQIAENKTYLERADRNLKNAQNSKEYETAMRETDSLQKAVAAFEVQIVEAMETVEAVDKEIEERAEEIATLDSKLEAAIKEHETQITKDKAESAKLAKQRETVFVTLPAQLASIYNRMAQRSRDGIAVAEVINGSCSACYMSLRPQILLEVKRGDQIITCESCTRIMYILKRDATEASA